jgi:hypothetical protein
MGRHKIESLELFAYKKSVLSVPPHLQHPHKLSNIFLGVSFMKP